MFVLKCYPCNNVNIEFDSQYRKETGFDRFFCPECKNVFKLSTASFEPLKIEEAGIHSSMDIDASKW